MMGLTANTTGVLLFTGFLGGAMLLSRFIYDKTNFNFGARVAPPAYKVTLTFCAVSVVTGVPLMHYTNPAGRIRY